MIHHAHTRGTLGLLMLLATASVAGQTGDPLLRRWVGTHQGRALFFDFHGDTMLVVNDIHVMDYWAGPDSIIAYNADTSFAVRYRAVYDKLLIETVEGRTVTMSPQPIQARPVFSGFGWDWGRWQARAGDHTIELYIKRIGSEARWRSSAPASPWWNGSWRREGRTFTFQWETPTEENPDSTITWRGFFDSDGHQFIFDETEPGSGLAIFRRWFRGRRRD